MVGQFKSTVNCLSCDRRSVCFDPFMLLSLPIPTTLEWHLFLIPCDLKRAGNKIKFEYESSHSL